MSEKRIYFVDDPEGARRQWLNRLNEMPSEELERLIQEIIYEISDLDLNTKEGAQKGAERLAPDVQGWQYAVAKQILEERNIQ